MNKILQKLKKINLLHRLNIIEFKLKSLETSQKHRNTSTQKQQKITLKQDKLEISINFLKNELKSKIKNILNDYKLEPKKNEKELNKLPLINYLKFENKFRGSKKLITQRQKPYIKYFKNCKKVLDIGSGRGEFLELLNQNNIRHLGIDIDENMVKSCKKRGLNVKLTDLFEYLLNCPAKFHDGIISLQVIEHLTPIKIQNIVKLCFDKTQKNSFVIFETINPLCLQALANFWADPTHQKPIVPHTLKHIFTQFGFTEVNIIGRTPVLPNVPDFIINPKDLTVYGDYAIIAKK